MGVASFEKTFFIDYRTYVFFENLPRNDGLALAQSIDKMVICYGWYTNFLLSVAPKRFTLGRWDWSYSKEHLS